MNRPMIVITARSRTENDNRTFYDNESYFQYVAQGGGIAVMTGAVTEEEAEEIAERFDGLVVTGGADVAPHFYGQENTKSYPEALDIDEADLYLYHAFDRRKKPILGICRGIQLVNVAAGGTLKQDIPGHNQRNFDPPVARDAFCQTCRFIENTKMYAIFGESYGMNSFHHQCVDTVAPGFIVSAYSEDGIIEAIEKDHITAVQWHPERHVNDPLHKEIMKRFVQECAEYKNK